MYERSNYIYLWTHHKYIFLCVELVKTGKYRVFDDIGKKCRKWLIGSRQKSPIKIDPTIIR